MMIVRSGFRFAMASLTLAAVIALPMGCVSWGAGIHAEGGNTSYEDGHGHGHGKAHPSHPLGGPPGQMKKHGNGHGNGHAKKHGKHGHEAHADAGISVSIDGTGTIRP